MHGYIKSNPIADIPASVTVAEEIEFYKPEEIRQMLNMSPELSDTRAYITIRALSLNVRKAIVSFRAFLSETDNRRLFDSRVRKFCPEVRKSPAELILNKIGNYTISYNDQF